MPFVLTQIFHETLDHATTSDHGVCFIAEIVTEAISCLAAKIWSLVPNPIKSSESLDVFKSKIRQWEPDCLCRLCKNYLQHAGFI